MFHLNITPRWIPIDYFSLLNKLVDGFVKEDLSFFLTSYQLVITGENMKYNQFASF